MVVNEFLGVFSQWQYFFLDEICAGSNFFQPVTASDLLPEYVPRAFVYQVLFIQCLKLCDHAQSHAATECCLGCNWLLSFSVRASISLYLHLADLGT